MVQVIAPPVLAVLAFMAFPRTVDAQPVSPFAGLPGAARDVCRPIAEQKLQGYGLTYDQLTGISWIEQKADSDRSAVSGYSLWARPPGCASGSLVIDFHRDCSVKQAYTRGGCRVSGIPSF